MVCSLVITSYFFIFTTLCPLATECSYKQWRKKIGFAALAFVFRGSFVLVSEPSILHQERAEDYGSKYRRILNSSSVTCKLKLWRSLQCIRVSVSLDNITVSCSISHPICLSHTVPWSYINEWNITSGYSCNPSSKPRKNLLYTSYKYQHNIESFCINSSHKSPHKTIFLVNRVSDPFHMYMTMPHFSILNLESRHFMFSLSFSIDEDIEVWAESCMVIVTCYTILEFITMQNEVLTAWTLEKAVAHCKHKTAKLSKKKSCHKDSQATVDLFQHCKNKHNRDLSSTNLFWHFIETNSCRKIKV